MSLAGFSVSSSISTIDVQAWSSTNYCDSLSEYFKCLDDNDKTNSRITHIFLNNSGIHATITANTIVLISELITETSLEWLDLSNNAITGQVHDWSPFGFLKGLSLANNDIFGTFTVAELTGRDAVRALNNTQSFLKYLDLSGNNFDIQEIEWNAFEFMPDLEYFDISNNQFEGEMETSYFENCVNLQHFDVGNNQFDGEIKLSPFQHCPNLEYFNVSYNAFAAIEDFDESTTETHMPNIKHFIIDNNQILKE